MIKDRELSLSLYVFFVGGSGRMFKRKSWKIFISPFCINRYCISAMVAHTETLGNGDLRFYGFIQFYPMLLIPLLFLLFPSLIYHKVLNSFLWVIARI